MKTNAVIIATSSSLFSTSHRAIRCSTSTGKYPLFGSQSGGQAHTQASSTLSLSLSLTLSRRLDTTSPSICYYSLQRIRCFFTEDSPPPLWMLQSPSAPAAHSYYQMT
jgi:hypothetical protein